MVLRPAADRPCFGHPYRGATAGRPTAIPDAGDHEGRPYQPCGCGGGSAHRRVAHIAAADHIATDRCRRIDDVVQRHRCGLGVDALDRGLDGTASDAGAGQEHHAGFSRAHMRLADGAGGLDAGAESRGDGEVLTLLREHAHGVFGCRAEGQIHC